MQKQIAKPTNNNPITPLRRSPRLRTPATPNPKDPNSGDPKTLKNSALKPSQKASANPLAPATPLRRSPRLNSSADGILDLRRSPRLSLPGNIGRDDGSKKRSDVRSNKIRDFASVELEGPKGGFLNKEKRKVGSGSSDGIVKKNEERNVARNMKRSDVRSNKIRHSASVQSGDTKGVCLDKEKWKVGSGSSDEIVNKNEKNKGARNRMRSDVRSNKIRHSASVESGDMKGVSLDKEKGKVGEGSSAEVVKKNDRRNQCCGVVKVVVGLEAVNARDRKEESKVSKKRKRGEEARNGSVKGWTKEQEMALQRAYIIAKPTPNFWKQVSKLVPGKSAKDCFDRVHSDHITPPQHLPRSRAKKLSDSSPLGSLSLSASGLLGSVSLKVKKLTRYNKQKSHIAHRNARQLLQKHNRLNLNYEADLFSVLEPNINPSGPDSELNSILSTPKHRQVKQGFLQLCNERSSQKKTSRLKTSNDLDILSPPVLKQVKNKALHEKYIDQLHCRDAKRKSARLVGKENSSLTNIPEIDMVRAAKNALVSDAVDAINTLQHLHANDSSDSDDHHLDMDDDESEGL
ncbi:Homeodomain-like superfamily protein [Euphorbia peplus]|nr:Homeodomain-like superfamily protein [Euphorbia peplus]